MYHTLSNFILLAIGTFYINIYNLLVFTTCNNYHTLSKHGDTRDTTIHIYNRVSRVQIAFKCTCKMSLINSNCDGKVFLNEYL
jgi:hypothetical protein